MTLIRHRGPVVVVPPTITLDPVTVRYAGPAVEAMFKRLRELPKEQGGTKKKQGRPKEMTRGDDKSRTNTRVSARADTEAATALGVSEHEARALETIFTTPGVPNWSDLGRIRRRP